MQFLNRIVSALFLPLLYINVAGLAAGTVWLGVIAQWQVVWLGVMTIFFSPYILPVLMIPAGIFSHLMTLYAAAKRPGRERWMFTLSISYVGVLLTLWCVLIFQYVVHSIRPDMPYAGLFWAHFSALTPLFLWANRDRSNLFIMTMVETAEVGMLAAIAASLLVGSAVFWQSAAVFGGVMALAVTGQLIYEARFSQKEQPLSH